MKNKFNYVFTFRINKYEAELVWKKVGISEKMGKSMLYWLVDDKISKLTYKFGETKIVVRLTT